MIERISLSTIQVKSIYLEELCHPMSPRHPCLPCHLSWTVLVAWPVAQLLWHSVVPELQPSHLKRQLFSFGRSVIVFHAHVPMDGPALALLLHAYSLGTGAGTSLLCASRAKPKVYTRQEVYGEKPELLVISGTCWTWTSGMTPGSATYPQPETDSSAAF